MTTDPLDRGFNRDLINQVEAIVSNASGDAFEGWPSYWDEHQQMRDILLMLLSHWRDDCERKAAKP